jgi:ATP-dependent helicase/nuclease subunit A
MSLEASNPKINATVSASAGSGKTWMLIARIVRLLLEGCEPGGILAMTFTRKAAAEMQQRLAERLYELATVDDIQLKQLLTELGVDPDPAHCKRARTLYEFHQYCDFPVRTQTFHSFCQDILARFSLEADVPPGFDLLENSSLLIQQARNALFNEAALNMYGSLAKNLQALATCCDGLFNMENALKSFLQHRSDWWAFTETAKHPCSYATKILQQELEYDADSDPVKDFFNELTLNQLKTFAPLLANTNKTNAAFADIIADCLAKEQFDHSGFVRITQCFLTQKNEPRVRKDSKSLRTKLKENADHYLELCEILPSKILHTFDQINKQKTFELNRLWYLCGEHFVSHYQKLKQELRQLDFTDLEWKTYTLLQHSENALWIQYKLDQRIDHFLIDEFQDTNPTQWHLILPLLEEIAASEQQRPRSVFLVGDEKQSIYSFRRAKPELQTQAANWLQTNLSAQAFPLNKSWRSSPAIINTVNAIFQQDAYQFLLPNFSSHETHKDKLPGKVELFPLIKQAEKEKPDDSAPIVLRNPLEQAREDRPSIYLQEGKQIADSIRKMFDQQIPISEGNETRAINYDDIFILVRKRGHLSFYEQALREAGIPYLSANKGTLMDCLEISDMEALLDTLLTPFNNLALAQVLKSPLFDASDDDLMFIAKHKGDALWIHRIAELHQELPSDHPIHRAHVCIARWQSLVDKIPVHDLLDRIYSEANVLNRYHSASPDSLKPRVQANLIRFLELALTLDGGRYPSLMHFLQYLRSLKTLVSDAPDEAPMETDESRVHIMTIHGSKGLEAPVVFLADTIASTKDRSSYSTLVDWPVDSPRPKNLQLIPGSTCRDTISKVKVEQQKITQQREDANLLYVAITRAKQYLFVSACLPEKKPYLDWYNDIRKGLENIGEEIEECHWLYQQGELQPINAPGNPDKTINHAEPTDDHLLTKLTQKANLPSPSFQIIAPSKTAQSNHNLDGDEDGLIRGIAIHRCLDLLSRDHAFSSASTLQTLASELNLSTDNELLLSCLKEAENCIQHNNLKSVFQPGNIIKIYNELPIQYKFKQKQVFGVIDRLIVSDKEALIIDYKSHIQAKGDNKTLLLEQYKPQMQLYADGIRQVWPDKTVKAALLFTHFADLEYIEI